MMARLLLLSLLAGNVLLRAFTNEFNVLPRALNLWDVGVTFALAFLALVGPPTTAPLADTMRLLRNLLLFNIVCILGSLMNPDYVSIMPAISQLVMWNEPVLLFIAISSLSLQEDDIRRFVRLLVFLVMIQVIIGFFQVLIFFRTGASEAIIGTFAGNAEQYQFFILIGFFFLLGLMKVQPTRRTRYLASAILILVLAIMIDNKASWVALAITLFYLIPRLPQFQNRLNSRWRQYILVMGLIAIGYLTATMSSGTYENKFGNLVNAWKSGNILRLGKIKATRDVLDAYSDSWHMAFVGSGLGTFYSRAAFQYFPFHIFEIYDTAPDSEISLNDSSSMSGIITPITGKKAFYKTFFEYNKIYTIGSGTADFPTSSYISLFGEAGLIGAILYLGFYRTALRIARSTLEELASDNTMFPLAVAALGALVYLLLMGFYNFWLDCGRINTIAWSLLAVSARYATLKRPLGAAVGQDLSYEGES